MRRVALLGVLLTLAVGAASAATDATNRPLLGIAGNADRFGDREWIVLHEHR